MRPQVARLGDGRVGQCRYVVGTGQPVPKRRVEQLGQFVGLEAEQAEVIVGRLR
jgi:hypothetical protein